MKNPDRIRSTGTIPLVLIFTAALVTPPAMLMAFPWVTRPMIERVLASAVEAAQPAEAAAAKPMVFEPTVITLAEADATVAAACATTPVPPDFMEACAALDEIEDDALTADDVAEPTFVPLCDQEVGPIGDLAVAVTYNAERGLMPFDVAEAVPPTIATYR